LDFGGPEFFGVGVVVGGFEAEEKLAGKLGALVGGERQCLVEEGWVERGGGGFWHMGIIWAFIGWVN
jgi:hypothetical protein